MKRIPSLLLVGLFFLSILTMPVVAQTKSMKFSFGLSVDGKDVKEVKNGDVITVALRLQRADSSEPYMMYAMQDEIRYDGDFFELVPDSAILNTGVVTTDIATVDRYREFYMNYLSMSGGTQWDTDTLVGSIQLRVIGTSGVSKITSQDYLVFVQDGTGSYPCEGNDVTIILSTDCIVTFMTMGGSEIADQKVQYGEKISCPNPPTRKGYKFVGWYTDIDLQNEWDFDTDTVESNMTLYAKWEESSETESEAFRSWMWLLLLLLLILLMVKIWYNKKKYIK